MNHQSWWPFSLWNTNTSFLGTGQLQIEPVNSQFIKLEMNKPTSKLDSTQNATLNCPISVWERCHQHFTTWIFSISLILILHTMSQQFDIPAMNNAEDQMSLVSGALMGWTITDFCKSPGQEHAIPPLKLWLGKLDSSQSTSSANIHLKKRETQKKWNCSERNDSNRKLGF